MDVRFAPIRHRNELALRAICYLMRCQQIAPSLFDHLVGASEKRFGNRKADRRRA
jgi:hypothetical protein